VTRGPTGKELEAVAPRRRTFLVRLCNLLYLLTTRWDFQLMLRARRILLAQMLPRRAANLSVYSDVLLADYRHLVVGDNVTINRGCHLSASGGLVIGNDVAIGHGTSILTTEHGYSDPAIPIAEQPAIFKPVTIGSNVWIGAQVCVLAGVSIADGTVIGAGSVVSRSVTDPDTIVAGVPARFIKERVDRPAIRQRKPKARKK